MRIAILTSGILPVPAVQGGAVENLIDFYLDYNNRHRLHDITVYSVWHPDVESHAALKSKVNHYRYIDTSSLFAKMRRRLYKVFHSHEYYNYFIEFFFEQAYRQIRKEHYDCIIIENRPGYVKKLAERGFDNVVLHLHNDLLNNTTPYHRQVFDSLNRILTVSDYIKSCVSTIEKSDKIVTIYNGINLNQFSRKKSVAISRVDMGFDEKDIVLVYSGRINKDKGIEELISAMLLLQDMPDIKLLVIGSTFFGNAANEDDFVRALVDKAKVISHRLFFTGFVPYDRMPDYLHMADIAIIPSIWNDPFPTTVLEAQAMGLPIICSNRGGIPEEVEKDNAIIVSTEFQYVENLANAIRHLYYSPQRRADMAKVSLRHSTQFDKNRFARDFFHALESLS